MEEASRLGRDASSRARTRFAGRVLGVQRIMPVVARSSLRVGLPFIHGARRKLPTSAARRVHDLRGGNNRLDPWEGTPTCPVQRKEASRMKVKWKHIVARLIPAATMVAALVVTIGAHADSVKWG